MTGALEAMLQILITSGIIWASTMAFKRAFRDRMSPRAHLVIWCVFIARLVVPVTFDTGFHLIELPAVPDTVPAAEAAQPIAAAAASYAQAQDAAYVIAPESADSTGIPSDAAAVPAAQQPSREETSVREARTHIRLGADPAEILLAVWIVGVLCSAALSVRAYGILKKDVSARMCTGADPLHLLFQECMSELGIRKRVFLAVQSELAGPALMFPNIVLISEDMLHMDPDSVRMALRHELTHFVRRDHVKALILSVLRTIWWFNPFVWLAVREIREDIETACDNEVVARLGKGGRKQYAKTVLSMFGRTETNQAVLGMAFGGARKNAERRIRGIYMKSKSKHSAKAGALLLSGVLAVACFTTACQPTPSAQAVVNQNEGAMQDAYVGESESANPEATTAPAAQYAPAERWTETIEKSDNFEITANVDVLMPDVDAYPVEKLARRDLTQELVDQLVNRFAPGVQFYEASDTRTKSEWEELILDMEEALAVDRELGDEEAIAADEETLEDWRRMYEEAPEEATRVPATTEFREETDYDGNVLEGGPIFLNIVADAPHGGTQMVSARKVNPTDSTQFPYFAYEACSYSTETLDLSNEERLASERASAQDLEEPYRSEELERLDELFADTTAHLALYEQNPIDLSQATAQAEALLAELGIRGAQVFSSEKALWGPYYLSDSVPEGTDTSISNPAVYLEFGRENGGIQCISQDSQNGIPGAGGTQYSAPFTPELGSIIMDQDWNVLMFQWDSPTQPLEIVAPDSELISVDEAKERLCEELYRNELAVSSTYIEEFGLAYDVEEMKLVMGYIDVQGEPENALAVPAWYMRAQGRQLEPEAGTGASILYNSSEVMINALDGSPILMPGTLQTYNTPSEEQ